MARTLLFASAWLLLTTGLCLGQAIPVGEGKVYKTVEGKDLHLYVVNPEGWKAADKGPAIVFFHGGGWTSGPLGQFNEHSKYLASRGMVAVQVEYRLLTSKGTDPPKVCIEDAKSALRWVRSHAGELGIDPQRIAAGGGSAGGHLAAFLGIASGVDDPRDDLSVSAKADALVLFNPVLDNGPGEYGSEREKDTVMIYSPAHQINAGAPPTIVFIGDKDELIPLATMKRFQSAMEKVGVRCELKVYEGQKHGFFNPSKAGGKFFYLTMLEADRFLASLGWLNGEPTIKPPTTGPTE